MEEALSSIAVLDYGIVGLFRKRLQSEQRKSAGDARKIELEGLIFKFRKAQLPREILDRIESFRKLKFHYLPAS